MGGAIARPQACLINKARLKDAAGSWKGEKRLVPRISGTEVHTWHAAANAQQQESQDQHLRAAAQRSLLLSPFSTSPSRTASRSLLTRRIICTAARHCEILYYSGYALTGQLLFGLLVALPDQPNETI